MKRELIELNMLQQIRGENFIKLKLAEVKQDRESERENKERMRKRESFLSVSCAHVNIKSNHNAKIEYVVKIRSK